MMSLPTKRSFLYALIGSVALSTVLGIVALLSGSFGWVEVRILFTTVTISAASICGLACGASIERGDGSLPRVGIALTLVGAALTIAGIWLEIEGSLYWKLALAISIFAAASAHLALLRLARLAPRFRWALPTAGGMILAVATLAAFMIVGELAGEGMFRLLGVAAILDAAMTITVPVFHRLSRSAPGVPEGPSSAARVDGDLETEITRLERRLAELRRERATRP